MRVAIAMTAAGMYMGSLYLSIHYPMFFDLVVFASGLVLGIAANDFLGIIPADKDRSFDPTPGLTRAFQEHMLDWNPEKTRRALKLKQMIESKIWSHRPPIWFYSEEARDYFKGLGPDVLDLYDDVLWTVINEGEHYAFRNPTDTKRTIVIRKEFAEKALVLGFIPFPEERATP